MVSQVASESTALVISRVVLQEFAVGLKQLEPEQHVKVAQIAIEKIQPRVVAFEDQISVIREDLSKVFEDNEQYVEAAKILIGIPLESGQRCVLSSESESESWRERERYGESGRASFGSARSHLLHAPSQYDLS